MNRYCVWCGKEFGPHTEKCCVEGSLVATKADGVFRKTRRWYTLGGKELTLSELAELQDVARVRKQHLASWQGYSEETNPQAENARLQRIAAQRIAQQACTREEVDRTLVAYREAAVGNNPLVTELAEQIHKAMSDLCQKVHADGAMRDHPSAQSTPEMVAEVIAERIAEAFSSKALSDLFKDGEASATWTLSDALPVWYSMGNLALVIAVWSVYKDKTRAFRIIDHSRATLKRRWHMPGDTFDKLLAVIYETEAAAVTSFASCIDGPKLLLFFSRYLSRMAGSPVPFSERSMIEDQLMGIKYRVTDPILITAVCSVFVDVYATTRQLLKNPSIEWSQPTQPLFTEPKQKGNGYGTLLVPPSDKAEQLLSFMSDDEKYNFNDLLKRLQDWHESAASRRALTFHPEARAVLWGVALAKIADHYREIRRTQRALLFAEAAWDISRYPVFAYNSAGLYADLGDLSQAKRMLQVFLAEYRSILGSPSFMLGNSSITINELEEMASSARTRLLAMQ